MDIGKRLGNTSGLGVGGVSRRGFLRGTAAGAAGVAGAAAGVSGAGRALAADKTVKIGFLAPLTGEVAAWGLPGLYGCEGVSG